MRRNKAEVAAPAVPRRAKRNHDGIIRDDSVEAEEVETDFVYRCRREFDANPANKVIRNSLTVVGLYGVCSNIDAVHDVTHLFNHSIKVDGTVATSQERTGRCWMFAGYNLLRHLVIKGLGVDNFEFSPNYLFFYDKLERSNAFMCEIMKTKQTKDESLYLKRLLNEPLVDGGFFSTFVNLVMKYGLVPKTSMNESFLSDSSDALNDLIGQILRRFAIKIRRNHRLSEEKQEELREKVLQQIYDVLSRALGKPPDVINWTFQMRPRILDGQKLPCAVKTISGMNPHEFRDLVTAGIDLRQFYTFGNYPSKTYHKMYQIDDVQASMVGGQKETFLNVTTREMKQMAIRSILGGMAVWFAGDVSRSLHVYSHAFDDRLFEFTPVVGEIKTLNKADRIKYQEIGANHAMCFVGVNTPDPDDPETVDWWQVENSWDYICNQPGYDGFYAMADKWFDDHVLEICIHRSFITDKFLPMLEQRPIVIGPMDDLGTIHRCQ